MREQRGMSGRQLARMLAKPTHYYRYRKGTVPKIELVVKLVDALELTPLSPRISCAPFVNCMNKFTKSQKGK